MISFFEEGLRSTSQSPDELRARARELRALPERTGVREFREAALALAERYEAEASARLARH